MTATSLPRLQHSHGLTGSPTGPDILFLVLAAATLLAAALTLGGLLAGPFG